MGFPLQGVVGPQNISDGAQVNQSARFSRDGSLIVQESHGKWFEQLSRGNIYKATTLTAGVALIVAATTGNHPTLWNPTASGFAAEFAKLRLHRLSGTDAPGSLIWASTFPAGAAIATGGPIATFTRVAVVNGLVGSAADAVMNWAPAINTFTVAPAFYSPLGINLFTVVTTAVVSPTQLVLDFDGDMGVGPNAAISLCCQASTTTSLWAVELSYAVSRV